MAKTASTKSSIIFNAFFIDASFQGFNDSLGKYLLQYLEMILRWTPESEEEFHNIKTKMIQEYNNFFLESPGIQA